MNASELELTALRVGQWVLVDSEECEVVRVNESRAVVRSAKGAVSISRWVPGELVRSKHQVESDKNMAIKSRGGLAKEAENAKLAASAEPHPEQGRGLPSKCKLIRALAARGATDEQVLAMLLRAGHAEVNKDTLRRNARDGRKRPGDYASSITDAQWEELRP